MAFLNKSNRISVKILIVILLSLAINSRAFELKIVSQGPPVIVTLNGTFDNESFKMINDLLDTSQNQSVIIYANSRGGYANDLLNIIDRINKHGDVTWISSDKCASSCAWAALSANKQIGTFYFHGIHTKETGEIIPLFNGLLYVRLFHYGARPEREWFGPRLIEVDLTK